MTNGDAIVRTNIRAMSAIYAMAESGPVVFAWLATRPPALLKIDRRRFREAPRQQP